MSVSFILDSEKPCSFLRCCIMSLQVVLQVLHMYFMSSTKYYTIHTHLISS
uniref:Uncharacterized protein n=1 Tax=uncultured marine crenarchaeote HF4000_APKG2O16 TaxID=455582 RepID=B3T704_9ARCH|nr:hypothetical protein ALOHA_HF4000APKG2O16ctg10g9 [uncultured marine crenarchaeote HF4000_APKG2O16]